MPSEGGAVRRARIEAGREDTGEEVHEALRRKSLQRRGCPVLPSVVDWPSKIRTKNRPLGLARIRSLVTSIRAI